MRRRSLLISLAAGALVPMRAMADQNIAGQWIADLDHRVKIEMDVLADGYWTSRTIENNKVVRELAGTYKQTNSANNSGTLVFTPTKSKVTTGTVEVETDTYSIQDNGRVLVLTADKNPMKFTRMD